MFRGKKKKTQIVVHLVGATYWGDMGLCGGIIPTAFGAVDVFLRVLVNSFCDFLYLSIANVIIVAHNFPQFGGTIMGMTKPHHFSNNNNNNNNIKGCTSIFFYTRNLLSKFDKIISILFYEISWNISWTDDVLNGAQWSTRHLGWWHVLQIYWVHHSIVPICTLILDLLKSIINFLIHKTINTSKIIKM